MPYTIETTVYTFDELTDERAKERARDWYREATAGDSYYAESVIEDAENVAALLGIAFSRERHGRGPAVYYSGFSSQGDGASYAGSYEYAKGARDAVRKYAPQDAKLHRIADALQDLQRRHFYGLCANITAGQSRYVHEMTMYADVERVGRDGFGHDVDADTAETLLDILRDFARWIYRQLEQEYEYQNSDEHVDESICANEYTFTADGGRF